MTEFEKAVNEIEKDDFTGESEQENVIEFLRDAKTATVTFSQGRYISKIKKLAERFPDEVQIVHENKQSIVAHIPVKYIKINRADRELTDEQKKELAERGRNALAGLRDKRTDSM